MKNSNKIKKNSNKIKKNSNNIKKTSNFKKFQFETIIDLNNLKSLYKRQLPETCIPLNSKEGKEIFSEALEEKNMECYFMLSIHLLTQSELAYCGISSLCMILNALEVDPMYNWKGQWRFFTEENIRYPPHIDSDIIKWQGITLKQYSEISKYNFLEEVKLCKASEITKEEFIQDIEHVSQQNREVMTLNFARNIMKQTGYGHICPLGGYNKKRRMVLLLDIARHKYPVYWVSIDMLWDAVNTIDGETGESR
ncbi:Phytochelatin-domain-containing protein [Neocallimastix lanati (nom. inval.)]|nr:Phytochelatin-domain-containing protein [Neocallimastix sp. JGI-2020a]